MKSVAVRCRTDVAPSRLRRRRFGLDTPLPADPAVVERAVLRHIHEQRPTVLVLTLQGEPPGEEDSAPRSAVDLAAGLPELFLLLPGGRIACFWIRTQAARTTRAQRAFADLCRERAIPCCTVRSLPEATRQLDKLLGPAGPEVRHG